MQLYFIILWMAIISAVSFVGSYYVRKYNRPDAIIGLFVAFVLLSNIVAYKIAEFNLSIVTFYATAASIIFPVTFLLTDIVNEKFGRKETQKMIFIAFFSQIAMALFIYIGITLSPAPFWADQESFAKILGFAPRIMLASWVAFLISENADAYIFSWFKKLTKGKHLWMRNVLSSIPSMALDTVIFVTIAFFGIQPLIPLMIGVLVLKWIIGIIDIPFMYWNRKIMGKSLK